MSYLGKNSRFLGQAHTSKNSKITKSSPLIFLRQARSSKNWKQIIEIGKEFLRSVDLKLITFQNHQLLSIYDEILIGAWYGGNKELSKKSAIRMSKLIPITKIASGTKSHYIANLKFNGINM